MTERRAVDISQISREIYRDGPLMMRTLQHWRPMICPYHILLNKVSDGARVLDVGCGAGLFLGMLAATGRIDSGFGFDSSAPEGAFDLISLIDVMHHVPVPILADNGKPPT